MQFGDFMFLGGGLIVTVGLCASLIMWVLPPSLL
jgi:hypothetical protein